MKNLLDFIIKSIVSKPAEVAIEEMSPAEGYVNLSLKVAPEDMGTVIGKQGRIIKAVRNLVRIKAIKEGIRVNVELVETGMRPQPQAMQPETPEEVSPQQESGTEEIKEQKSSDEPSTSSQP